MAESKGMERRVARLKKERGRKRVIRVGAVNITMHPHDETSYLRLLEDARRSRTAIPLHGKSHGRVGVFVPLDEDDPEGPHYGEFHRYINLNVDGRWYDTNAGKQADAEDVKKVAIPAHLKPEYEPYRFVFYPELHRLFFESKAPGVTVLSPSHVKKLLDGLFLTPRLYERYGKVEVTVEPEADTVSKILAMPTLRRLKIEVNRPNTDDFSAVERDVYDRLEAETAESIQETLVAQKGASLTPTQKTKHLCAVAASNGEVVGEGKNAQGRALKVSTSDYPWIEPGEYLSSVQDGRHAFLQKAEEMFEALKERIRK